MSKKHDLVLEKVLKKITVPVETEKNIEEELNKFLKKIQKRIDKKKYSVKIFVGGSFAKGTLIKKNSYDVDIYFRFNKKYSEEEIPKITKKLLRRIKGVSKIHGSRDYFRIKVNKELIFEIIPVKEVLKTKDALNITDLSFYHVDYVRKKMKSKKIIDGIKLAKAFCYANRVYGAESYVKGFSGYSLELLVYYYGGFFEFIKGLSKNKKEKVIIDIEKDYKNKKQILLDMNGSRLDSPIVLVDPTFKRRNTLAGLSEEKFLEFQETSKEFLKNPSVENFQIKKIDYKKIKEEAQKENLEFVFVELKTNKQEGDIAGTKLLKFFNHLKFEIEKYFNVEKKGFEYLNKGNGQGYFVVSRKKEVTKKGPKIEDKKNVEIFRKKHGNVFLSKERIYSKKKVNFSVKEFLSVWANLKVKKIKEMYITKFKIY